MSLEAGAAWKVVALPPLPEEGLRRLLGPLGERVSLSVPAARDRGALLDALGEAEIVVGDWTGELWRWTPRPSARLRAWRSCSSPRSAWTATTSAALADAGVPLANTARGERDRGGRVVPRRRARAVAAAARRRRRGPGGPLAAAGPRAPRAARLGAWASSGSARSGRPAPRLFGALGCEVSYWTPHAPRGALRPTSELDDADGRLRRARRGDRAVATETRGLIDPSRHARRVAAGQRGQGRGGRPGGAAGRAERPGTWAAPRWTCSTASRCRRTTRCASCPGVLLSPHAAGVTPSPPDA